MRARGILSQDACDIVTSLIDLLQIILIDLSLAGDNAIVVGMAVAALPAAQRKQAMTAGILAATLLRIGMAFFAVKLLAITGLLAAGGLLLLWVGWKMARELHALHHKKHIENQSAAEKFSAAVWQIILADISMSLDNVLGVAGVARDHMQELVIGLVLSVALMGLASSQIARLTARYPKIGYAGVIIILYTAGRMIYDGALPLLPFNHALV